MGDWFGWVVAGGACVLGAGSCHGGADCSAWLWLGQPGFASARLVCVGVVCRALLLFARNHIADEIDGDGTVWLGIIGSAAGFAIGFPV